jgi:hypothetical protein
MSQRHIEQPINRMLLARDPVATRTTQSGGIEWQGRSLP